MLIESQDGTIIISKVYPMRSHTCAAEGGAAGVIKSDDSLEHHFNDTVGGGEVAGVSCWPAVPAGRWNDCAVPGRSRAGWVRGVRARSSSRRSRTRMGRGARERLLQQPEAKAVPSLDSTSVAFRLLEPALSNRILMACPAVA